MAARVNPFAELIHVLKHNGYTNTPLNDIPGPKFFKLLKKGGWDQAWSGKPRIVDGTLKVPKTHILMRLREPTRGPKCGIVELIDFARALESGTRRGESEWVSVKYNARFIVNFKRKGFVTFMPLSD